MTSAKEMNETFGEFCHRLIDTGECSERDNLIMERMLVTTMFPEAKVLYGIVYIEGKGTPAFPPIPIQEIAQVLLKGLS